MAWDNDWLDAFDFTGSEWISMPRDQFDADLRNACKDAMPAGATLGFNYENDLALLLVSQPGDTRQVFQAARKQQGRS